MTSHTGTHVVHGYHYTSSGLLGCIDRVCRELRMRLFFSGCRRHPQRAQRTLSAACVPVFSVPICMSMHKICRASHISAGGARSEGHALFQRHCRWVQQCVWVKKIKRQQKKKIDKSCRRVTLYSAMHACSGCSPPLWHTLTPCPRQSTLNMLLLSLSLSSQTLVW